MNRKEIYFRFASCYGVKRPVELARILVLSQQTVQAWKTGKNPLPWARKKRLVDAMGLSWDWLIEGREPKHAPGREPGLCNPFDWLAINRRFLSLYPPVSQAKLGEILGIKQVSVHRMQHGVLHVSWERLEAAVTDFGVAWDWLLEG